MTDRDIIENNKLIAEFMSSIVTAAGRVTAVKEYPTGLVGFTYNPEIYLKFHSSWDWLMPVVEKIESLGFWVNIKKNHVTIARDNKISTDSNIIHSEFGDQTKIQRIYICVVEFIKFINWFNNTRNT